MDLYPRQVEAVLNTALIDTPVVCLLGPRQVGKTTLVQQLKPKRAYISFDDLGLLNAAKDDPIGFIEALPEPVILDEIQRVPELLLPIKSAVDKRRQSGQFLLTGSANLLLLPTVQDSLAGRMEIVQLNPLSEMEKHRQNRSLLQELIEGKIKSEILPQNETTTTIPEAICKGGYPEAIARSPVRARRWHRQYLDAIIQRDVKDVAAIRDENELLRLIELLSWRTASLLNLSSLANELKINRETVERYVGILERLFLIRRLPAWHRNNAKRLIKTPKVYVVDSGLAATLNNIAEQDWVNLKTEFGGLLESFVVQQLICQAGWVDNDLRFSHYRDKDKVEVDLVIEQGRKVWAVEVKRAVTLKNEDGVGLARLAKQVGKNFQGGILLYSGSNCLPLDSRKVAPNCFAVPLHRLWAK